MLSKYSSLFRGLKIFKNTLKTYTKDPDLGFSRTQSFLECLMIYKNTLKTYTKVPYTLLKDPFSFSKYWELDPKSAKKKWD